MNGSVRFLVVWSLAVLLVTAAAVGPAHADPSNSNEPIKIGLVIPTTGVVSAVGKEMQHGWEMWWDQHGHEIQGRPIETYIEDTAGDPSTGRLKTKLLVEQKNVDILVGPVLANVGLAMADYLKDRDVLLAFPVVAADDVTKRRRQWNVLRIAGWSSSQVTHPMGQWAASQGYKRALTIGNDYNFGHQNVGGFANTFTDGGGTIIKQIWNPIGTSDFSSYLAQILNQQPDVVFAAEVGADAVRFVKQWSDFGVKSQIPLLGNPTLLKQSNLNSMGDEALGLRAVTRYAASRQTEANRSFVRAYDRRYGNLPAAEAAATFTTGKWLTRAIRARDGNTDDIRSLIQTVKQTTIEESPMGTMKMDAYGNPIIDVHLVETVKRDDGRKWNRVIHTWEQVSQFWTYDRESFLQQPVYSRDYQGLN